MLDLKTEAIAGWLAVHGSEDLARSPPRADDRPELSDALAAFGSALDRSVQDGVEPLEAALHQGLLPSMAEVIAHLGPARRLRSEFDNALQQDRVFAASFNAVEKAAGRYGEDRLTLASNFQARKLDAGQLDARFQQADAAIGEAAEKIPGRAPGQNVMAEMAEKVSEILSKAVERVRQAFGKEVEAGPKASSSPGMSP